MSEDPRHADSYQTIVEFCDSGRPFAVAVVLKAEGSTPRKAGAKAVIDETGRIRGSIGGGSVEAETQRRAIEACRTQRAEVFDFQLEGAQAADDEPICGGRMRILIDPTAAAHRDRFARVDEALRQRERGVLLTIVENPAAPAVALEWYSHKRLAYAARVPGAEAIQDCLKKETARLFVDEEKTETARTEVFVEPVIPRPLLLIAGGGHIGQALAHQAALVGFDIAVIDDRPDFTDPALFPDGATTLCGDIAAEVAAFPIAGDTYIVIVTRGHKNDAEALEACIHKPAAYIGMIGSKRKVALMRKDFIESGKATEDEWNRVFAPIGLDIGAVTVPEIAASIVAQLIAVRRKGADSPPPGDMRARS